MKKNSVEMRGVFDPTLNILSDLNQYLNTSTSVQQNPNKPVPENQKKHSRQPGNSKTASNNNV